MRRLAVLALLTAVAACTPRTTLVPVPAVAAPKFPEFVAPVVPPALTRTGSSAVYNRAWLFLQAGDLKNAEREFSLALKAAEAFYPAEIGLGYVALARRDAKAALVHFDRALERQRRDVAALVGQGLALVALDREVDALSAFEAALAVDPSVGDVARRVEVLRFRGQQEDLNRAREAARAGRLDEAVSVYTQTIAISPDSAILYRELAAIERQQGNDEGALEHFRRAVALDAADARSLVQVGDILGSRHDFEGAAKAYAAALASEPDSDVDAKLQNARAQVAQVELPSLPGEYRAIADAAQVTRADLAALVGVRLGALLQPRRRDSALIIDIRNNWAATWIVAVTRAGVMEPFPNHAFLPRTVVRRTELAQVVSRLLAKLAEAGPGQPNPWQSARGKFTDLAEGHVAYPAVSAAVASGVITIDANRNFFPSRPVTGAEATEAIDRLDQMASRVLAKARPR